MEDDIYYKLCGGTFFTLLLQARKQRKVIRGRYENKRDNLSEPNVFAGMIRVVKPEYIEPEKQKAELKEQEWKKLKKPTSIFKNCKGTEKSASFPFMLPSIIEIFDKRVRNEYKAALNDMQEFMNDFIDIGIGIWLVERLLDLVEFDKSIRDTDVFYVCKNGQPMSKTELCDLSKRDLEVCLSAFLLGIWHFIICNKPDNTEGRNTIISWYEKNEVEGRLGKYIGPEKSNVERQIKIIGLDESGEYTDNTTDTVLENDDPFTHRIIDDLDNEIDTKVFEIPQNEKASNQMKKIFKKAAHHCHIEDFINREPELISFKNLVFNDDLLSCVVRFVEIIQSNIISLFAPYQNEMMYINISRFTNIVKEYNNYLLKTPPQSPKLSRFIERVSILDLFDKELEQDSGFKKETDYYRQQIKSLYKEICGGNT